MPAAKKRSSILEFALVFLLVYVGSQLVFEKLFPDRYGPKVAAGITLQAQDATVKGGHDVILLARNTTSGAVTLAHDCPQAPVEVHAVDAAGTPSETLRMLSASGTAVPCAYAATIAAGETVQFSLAPWKYSLLSEMGTYEARLILTDSDSQPSVRFSLNEAGPVTQIFRTFVTKPLLALLILIASILPGHGLGLSIILLTLVVKLVLFVPTQHAMEGQRKLQNIQPKVDELRRKYKADPQKLNQETLKLWKQEKINPMQSCLPTLLQFPILIGLFYVVRDGSVLQTSQHLLYSFHRNLPWVFDAHFLGMDLLKPNVYVFPALLLVLQFLQMKLTFMIAKKKSDRKKVIDVTPDKKKKQPKDEPQSAQEMQQKMMTYGLPIMVAVFAVQFPAAVALYWAISTVFGIGQQLVVNRKHL